MSWSLESEVYCTVLYCTPLYCTVLYRTVPYRTVPYRTVLCCTLLLCAVLSCQRQILAVASAGVAQFADGVGGGAGSSSSSGVNEAARRGEVRTSGRGCVGCTAPVLLYRLCGGMYNSCPPVQPTWWVYRSYALYSL